MIEAISIQNFQAHAKEKYKLAQVTTFTGPSDSGKSSIIRALGWLAFNRPRGTDFIREGVCSVAAKVDGRTVGRRRGKSVNEYRLDKESFKAIGSDVPEQVADLLALDPEISLQGQHDVPFWVGLPSAEVARRLNKIADLESIDTTLAALATKTREAASKEKVLVELLAEVEDHLQPLDGIEELDRQLKESEEAARKVDEKKHATAQLLSLIIHYENTSQAADKARDVHRTGRAAYKRVSSAADVREKTMELSQVVQRIEECVNTEPPPCFEGVDAAFLKLAEARERSEQLGWLLDKVAEQQEAAATHKKNAEKGQAWLSEHVKVCSECGREL